MPIAPRHPFVKFTCHACGWSAVTYQGSDAINRPSICPKCEATDLDFSKANALESMQAFPAKFIQKFFNNN